MKTQTRALAATLLVFIALYLIGAARFPGFRTARVPANLLTDNAVLGIVAVGMTFAILAGGIDLSVGSVIAFISVFCALMINTTHFYPTTVLAGNGGILSVTAIINTMQLHPIVVFAMALVIGTAFGTAMGAVIHFLNIPPFIVTLAGLFLARGATFLLTTQSVGIHHPFYLQIYDVAFKLSGGGRIPLVAMMFLVVVVAGIFVAHFTEFGRNVYALGGDESAALLLGIPVGRTKIGVYALSGFLAALAGVAYSLSTSSGYPLATTGMELDAIAAVVIGGTLLTGGAGYVAGTFIGVLITGTIQTYLNFDGTLNVWWIKIVIGFLLFLFIALQKILSNPPRFLRLIFKSGD